MKEASSEIAGKRGLVTGASRGIGRAIAKRSARKSRQPC